MRCKNSHIDISIQTQKLNKAQPTYVQVYSVPIPWGRFSMKTNSTQQAFSNARNQQTQEQQVVETVVREQPKIGRNERVTIKNVMSGEEKEVKYKQALPLIEKGTWVLYNK